MDLDLWNSNPGPVSAVDPNDLRKVWTFMTESQGTKATGINFFESICSPGADVVAVWYRTSLLKICESRGLLSRWLSGGRLDDAVIEVAADFPMDKMGVGVVRNGLPFDVQEFLKRVDAKPRKAEM
jgi:hypothetical protein